MRDLNNLNKEHDKKLKKFIIHQNYTIQGTNYFEVEANTLKEAQKRWKILK